MSEKIGLAVVWLGVSTASGQVGQAPDKDCLRPCLSADGRIVVFDSAASNLHANDTNSHLDVYLFDRTNRRLTLISATPGGAAGSGISLHATTSGDGRLVAFASEADDLVEGDTVDPMEIFVFDRAAQEMTRTPIAGSGATGPDGDSRNPMISADGRYVTFDSMATNLVSADANGVNDVFVHELATGRTERISVGHNGWEFGQGSFDPSISGDGRFIAFVSVSDEIVPGDFNAVNDVFLHDRETGETVLVSRTSAGEAGNSFSQAPAISSDGMFVAFESWATNLTEGGSHEGADVFVFSRATERVTCVSVAPDGSPGSGYSHAPAISGDGSAIVFESFADNLCPDPVAFRANIFARFGTNQPLRVLTRDAAGTPADKDSAYPAVSGDGRVVALSTKWSGFTPGVGIRSATIVIVGSEPGAGEAILAPLSP